jgi:hypothetical protein
VWASSRRSTRLWATPPSACRTPSTSGGQQLTTRAHVHTDHTAHQERRRGAAVVCMVRGHQTGRCRHSLQYDSWLHPFLHYMTRIVTGSLAAPANRALSTHSDLISVVPAHEVAQIHTAIHLRGVSSMTACGISSVVQQHLCLFQMILRQPDLFRTPRIRKRKSRQCGPRASRYALEGLIVTKTQTASNLTFIKTVMNKETKVHLTHSTQGNALLQRPAYPTMSQ